MKRPSDKAKKGSVQSNSPFTRQASHRSIKTRILIVGEGQKTEPNYFRGMREETAVREHYAITVKGAHGFSQDAVVQEAIKHKARDEYDEVWCVLDVEGPSKATHLAAACSLAEKHKITLWLSNPSIEVWFLLHLVRQARQYPDGDAAEKELQKHWAKRFPNPYQKSDSGIYAKLRPLLETGLANARWVLEKHHKAQSSQSCNSSTDVYKAVLRLMPHLDSDIVPKRIMPDEAAPDFELTTQNGESLRLSSLRGKTVVLFFLNALYSTDSRRKISLFEEARNEFAETQTAILGICPVPATALQLIEGESSFSWLLFDVDHAVRRAYGLSQSEVGSNSTQPAPLTFIISPEGKVVRVIDEADVQKHVDQVRTQLGK